MDRINGANTVDIGSGRRGFRQQNVSAGLAGTELTAAFFNAVQEEILTVIEGAGIDPSDASWTQLRQAIAMMIAASVPEVDMSPYLQKAGGTMLGPLFLTGAPTEDNSAATKSYIDGLVAALLARAGDTMTGFLTLHAAPINAMHAANKQYVDGRTGESHLLAVPGYQVFPSGLILQWSIGANDPAGNSEPTQTITWPLAFPAACFIATVSMDLIVNSHTDHWYQTAGWTKTAVSVRRQMNGDGSFVSATRPIAFGIGI